MVPLRGCRIFSLLIIFLLCEKYACRRNIWPSPYYRDPYRRCSRKIKPTLPSIVPKLLNCSVLPALNKTNSTLPNIPITPIVTIVSQTSNLTTIVTPTPSPTPTPTLSLTPSSTLPPLILNASSTTPELMAVSLNSGKSGNSLDTVSLDSGKEWEVEVVGGRNATVGEIPYQVSIRLLNMNHNCGGCLIDNEWVLTAAHCLGNNAVRVTAGTIDLKSGGKTVRIIKKIKHPEYNQTLRMNDIGLVKLNMPLEFNDNIKALSIPTSDTIEGKTLTLSGWGFLKYADGFTPNDLQVLDVKTITNSDCTEKWSPIEIYSSHLCTFGTPGKGFCKGDSGGPLAANGEIYGIVSFGAACGTGLPDVYTRVYSYLDWIFETIASN